MFFSKNIQEMRNNVLNLLLNTTPYKNILENILVRTKYIVMALHQVSYKWSIVYSINKHDSSIFQTQLRDRAYRGLAIKHA